MKILKNRTLGGWAATATAVGTLVWAGLSRLDAADSGWLSPIALAATTDGSRLYVAAATEPAVLEVAPNTGTAQRRLALPDRPAGLAILPNGQGLLVVAGGANGRLCQFDLATGQCVRRIDVGHTPSAVVAAGDGRHAYVANRFHHNVSLVDLERGRELKRIPVLREPVGLELVPDGRTLVVANFLPADPATAECVSAQVSFIDTAADHRRTDVRLPNGSTALRGVAVTPDGKEVYLTHSLGRYTMPASQLDRGWINTSALTVINAATREIINTVLLDDVDLGAADPWDVRCTRDGRWVVVSHAGTHELSVIDRAALRDRLARVARGETVSSASTSAADVPNDLSFLVGLRQRVPLKGKGPRGLALVGSTVYVSEYFSDSLGVYSLDPVAPALSIALGASPAPDQVRWGEQIFFDASYCFQQWQSCATCHPDGRVDGLNWDLLNDGLGNPKNTKSMLLSHRTPPAMSLGVRETAETAVRAGIRHILFAVRPEAEAEAIDAYLKSLTPVPSPYLNHGRLSAAAKRGARHFQKAGCVECHPGPLFTDQKPYDVGTGTGREQSEPMDTPSLVEVWRTAPYLHDGRATTMREVFQQHNPGDRHGTTSNLSPRQLDDLIEYVLSL